MSLPGIAKVLLLDRQLEVFNPHEKVSSLHGVNETLSEEFTFPCQCLVRVEEDASLTIRATCRAQGRGPRLVGT